MAKSKAKNRQKPPRPAARFVLRLCLWLGSLAAVAVAVCMGSRTLWAAVVRQPQFRVNPSALSLNGHPDWVRGRPMARALHVELSSLPDAASIFTGDLAHRLQHELRGSPWVLDVTRVQRSLPDKLIIKPVFRKPAGVVLFRGQYLLVDADGHYLPDDVFTRPLDWAGEYTPYIIDRSLDTPPPVGVPWDGPKLAVGARLTEFLRRNGLFEYPHVTAIDVSRVGRDTIEPEIVLIAASGAQVKWGRSSVYEHVPTLSPPVSEPSDEKKLEALVGRLQRYRGLQGIEYLDLRVHGQLVITRGPQPAPPADPAE
jgi:hypothetical protein